MEEDKAAAYYDELTRKGEGAARFKQGLGFSSSSSSSNPKTANSSNLSPFTSFVPASNPRDAEKRAQLETIHGKLNKNPNSGSDDLRSRRQPSSSSSGGGGLGVGRDRSSRSSRDGRDRESSHRRNRSRSRSPYREARDKGSPERRSSKNKRPSVDYSALIEGYSQMTPVERVKAKMKVQLSQTAAKDTAMGMNTGWERFDFNKDAPLDDEDEIEASTTTKKKGRGKFKGSKIYQMLAGNRQPISVHFDPRGGKPAGDNGSSLAYEIGLLARTQISLEYKSWTKVPNARREELLDQVREKFTSDASEEVFRSYCFGAFRDRFKEHRCDLNTHFKSFESTDLARQNPPPDISLEDWDLLCTRFDSEAFRKLSKTNQSSRSQLLYNHVGGTRSFVSHRASHATVDEDGVSHDIGGIELFKLTHVNAAGHWTAPEAENRHSSMVHMMEQQRLASQEAEASGSGLPENLLSEAEICSQVAGRRYTRAIGEGSQSGGRTSRSSSQQFMTMQEEMRLLRERDAERERAMLQLQQRDAEREQREADREQAMRQMQEENDRRFAEIRRMFGGGGSGFGGFGNE